MIPTRSLKKKYRGTTVAITKYADKDRRYINAKWSIGGRKYDVNARSQTELSEKVRTMISAEQPDTRGRIKKI